MEILSWLLVEAFGAAALIGLLVWWSWPRAPKDVHETHDSPDTQGSDITAATDSAARPLNEGSKAPAMPTSTSSGGDRNREPPSP